MTVSTAPTPLSYNGNGSTTAFPITWKYNAKSHIVATLRSSTGTETTWMLNTNYTLTSPGVSGTLTALVAPAVGETLVITLEPPNTQSSSFPLGGDFPSATVEDGLDLSVQRDAKIEALFLRALRVPRSDSRTGANLELPIDTARASKFLAFDANGSPIAAAGSTSSGAPVSVFMATVLDDTTAAAARTTLGVPSTTEAIQQTLADAKGDLIVATAADVVARLAAGSNGLFLETASATSTGLRWGGPSKPFDARLTLTTATAVTTSDVTAATTIFLTPYKGDKIALYDGTDWRIYTLTEISAAVPASTATGYDVFVYDSSGTLTLDITAWTNLTTRATALVLQNGVYVKTGATSRRYVGSFRTTTVSGQTEDSLANRWLWNYYNRVERVMLRVESTDTWNYTTATLRQANGSTSNQLNFFIGVDEQVVKAKVNGNAINGTGNIEWTVAIGLDSTSAKHANCINTPGECAAANVQGPTTAEWVGHTGVGGHMLAWLEWSEAGGTTAWKGDDGTTTKQAGMIGSVFA